MSVPCEVAVKCVLPVVRAMIAKELIEKHHMKQVQAAELLRVSQPAISLYCRRIRGKAIDLEQDHDIKNLIHKVTETLAKNKLTHRELVQAYCNICRTVRAKGLLCRMHRRFDMVRARFQGPASSASALFISASKYLSQYKRALGRK